MDDVRRLVRPAPARHRRQVRAVGLGQDPLSRHVSRRFAQLLGTRIGDVAGEREVVATLERHLQEPRRRETVEDDRSVEPCECSRGLRIGVSVVDDDRLAELPG